MAEEIKNLQDDLSKAAQEKLHIESSLSQLEQVQNERAKKFGSQLQTLRSNSDKNLEKSDSETSSVHDILDAGILSKVKEVASRSITSSSGQEALSRLFRHIASQEAYIKKLTFDLQVEKNHTASLRADTQQLKQLIVNMQASAEQEEEYISNKLLKRIENLKREKTELLIKVEQEEEMITNTLQKKLSQLQKEKIDMEVALEQEQEFIVNRLQKQLDSLRQQQNSGSTTPMLKSRLSASHSPSSGSFAEFPPPSLAMSPGIVEIIKAEAAHLRNRLAEADERERKHLEEISELKRQLSGISK